MFCRDSDEQTQLLAPPNPDEIKDDQWLGGTVRSQGAGGDVLVSVACGRSQWQSRNDNWNLSYVLEFYFPYVKHNRTKTVDIP